MSKAPAISFSHVGIFVQDLPAMERFYTTFLGLTVTDRGGLDDTSFVFMSGDPKEHHQVILVTGRPKDLRFNVVNQISFRVDGLPTLRRLHEELVREAAAEIRPISHGNALSVYCRDPEGNRVELFIDTPWYVDQPMRIPMDMSMPDADLWKWAEDGARRLPGFKPAAEWKAEVAARMGRD